MRVLMMTFALAGALTACAGQYDGAERGTGVGAGVTAGRVAGR